MRNLHSYRTFRPNRVTRMHRTSTPLSLAIAHAAGGERSALRVSGTMTVLVLLTFLSPGTSSAQSIGTMQVMANVIPADAAWAGLAAAQELAQSIGRTLADIRTVELPLSQIRLEGPVASGADPALRAISIQYLRN